MNLSPELRPVITGYIRLAAPKNIENIAKPAVTTVDLKILLIEKIFRFERTIKKNTTKKERGFRRPRAW